MYINILSTASVRGEEWRKTDSLYDPYKIYDGLVNLRVGVIPFNEKCVSTPHPTYPLMYSHIQMHRAKIENNNKGGKCPGHVITIQ